MSSWQQVLIAQAQAHGQPHVAKELGVSKTVISQLINNKYPGDLMRMQRLVEGAYMQRIVQCPIMGDIALHECDKHQHNKSTSNPIRLRLYRACRSGCQHSALTPKPQFKRIAVRAEYEQPTQTSNKQYTAESVYSRLERQSVSDNGGTALLNKLLKQELIAIGTRYNRLLKKLELLEQQGMSHDQSSSN